MNDFFTQEGIERYFIETFLPLLLTFIFAWLVGYERKRVGKSAGISPHVLVSIAACAVAIMQRQLSANLGSEADDSQRIIAQVISGIGFLGAGVILKGAGGVKGLTTASTIWACAMMGLIFGMRFWSLGITLGLFLVIFIYARECIKIRPMDKEKKDEIIDKEER